MKILPRIVRNRRALTAICCAAALPAILAITNRTTEAAGVGPDVVVFSISVGASSGSGSYGSADGFASYSIATTSCNRGDTPLNWCRTSGCAPGATSEDHPVIAQNLYRLKSGRFEQIGMSWVKHGFTSLNQTSTGCTGVSGQSCQSPPFGGRQLGVGCTDPYSSQLNGDRSNLGPRSEVNATTGIFPMPFTIPSGPYKVYDERIKVPVPDVDPAVNAGALYWIEGQYVANDDAGSGNALNNATYRRVTVGNGPTYGLTTTGASIEQQPAIYAWKAQDPSVTLINADLTGSIIERYHVGRRVTDLGGGLWHYEYAVHNLNSDRAARAFSVQFSSPTNFTNVGFKDIEHHSSEPYSGTDWTPSSSGALISWSADTFANDQNANALRWGTMYNFWFDADQPPEHAVGHALDLFKPGTPTSVAAVFGNDLFGDGFEPGTTDNWSGTSN